MNLPLNYNNLNFKSTITSWDESIPLGNGTLGALIWGEPNSFRFSLDRNDIWDTTPNPEIFSKDFTYQKMLELLLREGEYQQLLRECIGYFEYMADRTGTLWENQTDHASCNHGFASYAAVFILEAEKHIKNKEIK